MRVSTVVLIVAFFALFWVYHNFEPRPERRRPRRRPSSRPASCPIPNYTWVPRTNVRRPKEPDDDDHDHHDDQPDRDHDAQDEPTAPTSPTPHDDRGGSRTRCGPQPPTPRR